MKTIQLSQNEKTIVEDNDYKWLNQWKWSYHIKGYAVRKDKNKWIRMNRFILGCFEKEMVVHHKNKNKLDNRRNNLQKMSLREHLFLHRHDCGDGGIGEQKKYHKGKWKYRGITRCGSKWEAQIFIKGKKKYIGIYSQQKLAALAYNKEAVRYYGEYAMLNKI